MDSTGSISRQEHDEEIRKLKALYKPNNVFNVPVSSTLDFFKWWCIFLRPFIPLTDRESDVVASFLKQRYELSKSITDPVLLDTMVMSSEVINRIVEECKITKQHFYVVMGTLKKKNVINKCINPRLIPNIRVSDDGVFKLIILFKDDEKA